MPRRVLKPSINKKRLPHSVIVPLLQGITPLHAINLYTLDTYSLEKLDAIVVAVWVSIDNALDARLYDELGALRSEERRVGKEC